MTLLQTSEALAMLHQTSHLSAPEPRAEARFAELQAVFADDLRYLESELDLMCREAVRPANEAGWHLMGAAGKRIRPLTVLLASRCFGDSPRVARELAIVAELVHSATLLHDDVIDDGMERRGLPTARRVWGNAVSVLTGDLLLTHALDRTFHHVPEVLADLLRTLRRLVDGEVVQLRGRCQVEPSEEVYFRILEDKTASLFGWSARSGARVGGGSDQQSSSLGTFGERVGIAFQLVDDVLDYAGDPSVTGKALLVDLEEGKMTLPLVLAIRESPALLREVELVRRGDEGAALRISQEIARLGVCSEVRRRARAHTEAALTCLASLPSSPAREMLGMLARELTSRGS